MLDTYAFVQTYIPGYFILLILSLLNGFSPNYSYTKHISCKKYFSEALILISKFLLVNLLQNYWMLRNFKHRTLKINHYITSLIPLGVCDLVTYNLGKILVIETKHRRWRETQFMTSCGGSQPYPNPLFSTTPFYGFNPVSLSK